MSFKTPDDYRGLLNVDRKRSAILQFVPFLEHYDDQLNTYLNFLNCVLTAHPEWSSEYAVQTIENLKARYGRAPFDVFSLEKIEKTIFQEQDRLTALFELGVTTRKQEDELKNVNEAIANFLEVTSRATGVESDYIREKINYALRIGTIKDLFEAQEILTHGPIVTGFDTSQDATVPDAVVRQLIIDCFGLHVLCKAKLTRIQKDNKYLVFSRDEETILSLVNRGILHADSESHSNAMVAEDREKYLLAAMELEKVSDSSELRHLYKVRATPGHPAIFDGIKIRGFGVENPSTFNYLDHPLLQSKNDQMCAYILGTIVHEVAHMCESLLTPEIIKEYKKIILSENPPSTQITHERQKFVTDYVALHQDFYGSDEHQLFQEDLAESVRIYTTHSVYLRQNFPQRYVFIQKYYPFLKADAVIEALK